MLALRTREGIPFAELTERYGDALGVAARQACRDAAAELPAEWIATGLAEAEAPRLALADPEGLLFSNDAISTVFARLDERLEAQAHAPTGEGGRTWELWDPTTTTFSCTATGRELRRARCDDECADVTLCVCVFPCYCYMERAMWYACFLFARTSPRIGSLRPRPYNNRTLIYAPFFVSRDRKGYPCRESLAAGGIHLEFTRRHVRARGVTHHTARTCLPHAPSLPLSPPRQIIIRAVRYTAASPAALVHPRGHHAP